MIHVAVVEDEEKYREQLSEFLSRYGKEKEISIQTRMYCDGIDILDEYAGQFEVILLDIRMKHIDGMEAARKIREKDKEVIIIFITNMAEYAIQGYDVEARGFILKPVRYKLFAQQMDRARKELESKKAEYLSLQLQAGVRNVSLNDIFYMENREHYLHIHLEQEDIIFYCTIKEMEKRLEGKPFFRCNSGLIVNLANVQSVKNNDILLHCEKLTVIRSRKKEFMEQLTEYMGEGEYV